MAQRKPTRTEFVRGRDPGPPAPPVNVSTLPVATPSILIGIGVIFAAAVVAFWSTFSAGMISWDDPDYIRDNLHLHKPDTNTHLGEPDWAGLLRLWNPNTLEPQNLQQYYPLVFSTIWLEYYAHYHAVTQFDAQGKPKPSALPLPDRLNKLYTLVHVDNFLLHLVNIVLIVWLVRRLGFSAWVALAAAAVFAVHPTQVASVVWMSERKNTLSGVFYLLAFILYLRHRRAADENPAASESARLILAQAVVYGVTGIGFLAFRIAQSPPGFLIPVSLVAIVVGTPLVALILNFSRPRGWGAYLACMAAFMAAMFSKTQTLTLFMSLMLADWLLQSRGKLPRLHIGHMLIRVLPMVVAGVIMTQVTARIEHSNGPSRNPTQITYQPDEQPVISTPPQRPLIAATAAWFYVYKFLAPVWLAPVYERWRVDIHDFKWYLPFLGWVVAVALAFFARKRIGGPVLFGMANFVIVIAPPLGLAPFNYQQYSFVADHFLYLACMYGGLTLAVLIDQLLERRGNPFAMRAAATGVGLLLLAACTTKSHFESRYWTDIETFWTRANTLNPRCYPGHLNLGNHFWRTGHPVKSIPLYFRCCEIQPRGMMHFQRLMAVIEAALGQNAPPEIIRRMTPLIKATPGFFPAQFARGNAYERIGMLKEACDDYRGILEQAPPNSQPWNEARMHLQRLKCP